MNPDASVSYNGASNGNYYKINDMPSEVQLEEEPMYVNAKQYHRILRRRSARAKWEAQMKANKAKVKLYFNFKETVFARISTSSCYAST